MKFRPAKNKGVLLVLAIGMMVLVEFMTIHQLDSIKISFALRRQFDYQQFADLAARSGIDYGYTMIKNTMEAMSLVDIRFATHMFDQNGNTGRIAEVPPSWQEIINPYFDRSARDNYGSGNEVNWVGTDSFDMGVAFSDTSQNGTGGPKNPLDYNWAIIGNGSDSLRSINSFSLRLENPSSGHKTEGFGLSAAEEAAAGTHFLAECAEERLDGDGSGAINPVIFTYFDGPTGFENTECDRQDDAYPAAEPGVASNWQNIPTAGTNNSTVPQAEAFEYSYPRDGHFGTKRWHYYDSWNYSPLTVNGISGENIPSDTASSNPRGTGGVIRFDPDDLSAFSTHRHIFFERLFNYQRDSNNLQYPYEPLSTTGTTPEERDATQDSYQVQMFTALNLDELGFSTASDEEQFNHLDYSNVKYKVFFKLWVTRDELRDGYSGNLSQDPGRVTTAFITHNQNGNTNELLNWAGNAIITDGEIQCGSNALNCDSSCDYACDLHPIWSIPRQTGSVYNGGPNITVSSYWRPNYLTDFMDTDAPNGTSRNNSTHTDHRLGVLQFPVPYLAYQRADKDYWDSSVRGTSTVSSTSNDAGIPLDHIHYTRFTLWSLGTVREINQSHLNQTVAEEDQRIDHFEIVSRALYKLVFYMDTRAVEVNNEIEYREGLDTDPKVAVGVCSGSQNLNNTAAFNAIYIPSCDVDPNGNASKLFEPIGIYLESTEKVDYMDSRLN